MKFLNYILYCLDLFKSPMYLLFDSKRKVSSVFSSLISLGIILFLLIFFFQSDIFSKKSPISSVQSIATASRPNIDFHSENMVFAIGLTDYVTNEVHDPSVFSLALWAYGYYANGEPIYEINKTLVKCKEEYFKDYGTAFTDLDMQKYYCMEQNSFTLQGYWDEKITQFIEIKVNKCNNQTMNNTCKSNEEIEQFFKEEKYFSIFYTDNMIDINNYEKPIQRLYKNKYFLMDGRISKKITFYFKKVDFFNDDGVIYSNDQTQNSFLFGNFEVDYVSENSEWIANLLLYTSSETYVVKRRYQKIQEVIANLGGLANALVIFGYLLTALEKQFIYFTTTISRLCSGYAKKSESN